MSLAHGPRRGELLNQTSNELWNLANSHYRAQTMPDILTIRILVLIIIPTTPAKYEFVDYAMICIVSFVFILSYPPTHYIHQTTHSYSIHFVTDMPNNKTWL